MIAKGCKQSSIHFPPELRAEVTKSFRHITGSRCHAGAGGSSCAAQRNSRSTPGPPRSKD